MPSKKQFSAVFLFFCAVFSTFSEGYGFSSNHDGVFAWAGLIIVSVVVIFIASLIVQAAYEKFDLNAEYGYTNSLLVSYGVIASLFSIISIWILPTYFLSIYACLFALVPIIPFVRHKGIFPKIASVIITIDMFFIFFPLVEDVREQVLVWSLIFAVAYYLAAESLSYIHKENLGKPWLPYVMLVAVTLLSIFSYSLPIFYLIVYCVVIFFGIKSFRKHRAKVAATTKNVFGISKKEIKKILNDFKSNFMTYPNRNPSFEIQNEIDRLHLYLARALESFYKENQNQCIKNLERFSEADSDVGDFVKKKKGKQNHEILRKFYEIFMNLANEVGYYEYSSADFESSISPAQLNEQINDLKSMYRQIKEFEESAGKQHWSWVEKIKACLEDAEDESFSVEERYRRAVEGVTRCKDYEEAAQDFYGSEEDDSEENADSSESESEWENYYKILFGENFDKSKDYTKVDAKSLKKQYLKMAKKYHPDIANEEQKAEFTEIMNKLNQIWEVLSDPAKRAEYDKSYNENL